MEKKQQHKKEETEEEEVEEIEEVEEEEDEIGEDFSKDPRAYALWLDAGKIADAALSHVISLVKPEGNIYKISSSGDEFIHTELNKVYNKKKYIKGIAFINFISYLYLGSYGHICPSVLCL